MDSHSSIKFDPVTHTYRVGGKILPSVTQLLPKQDYFVSDERLTECAEEGTANHAVVEDFHRTGISTCGYTDAIKKFMKDHKKLIGGLVESEIKLASDKGFAGCPDMLFERAVVDLKRSAGNKKIHALQLAGYHILAVENGIIKPTKLHYILIAREDGGYDVCNVYNLYSEVTFLSLLQRYKIDKAVEYYLKSL